MKKYFALVLVSIIVGLAHFSVASEPTQSQKILTIRKKIAEFNQAYKSLIDQIKYAQQFRKFEQPALRGPDEVEDLTDWHLQGPQEEKGYEGINETGLKNLNFKPNFKPVIVAVLDGGVNTEHEAIRDYILTNSGEKDNNGIDDDKNGYVDDVAGWDFVGKDLDPDTMELTRENARCQDESKIEDAADAEHCEEVKKSFAFQKQKIDQVLQDLNEVSQRVEKLQKELNLLLTEETAESDMAILKNDPVIQKYSETYRIPATSLDRIRGIIENINFSLEVYYSDDYVQKKTPGFGNGKIGYGSPDAIGLTPGHGTHVTGIIIKIFENAVGGKANAVKLLKILPVRVVPDGDERDEDVANAIRYAVDRGANIIQMSFGKNYSSKKGKKIVDSAVQYANSKGVLMVHSSGNDGMLVTTENNFPNSIDLQTQQKFSYWTEIGNSSIKATYDEAANKSIAAYSSNFGSLVDIFAPGTSIYSSYSDKKEETKRYRFLSGTSMAAPVFSGIMAVMLSAFDEKPLTLRNKTLQAARTNHADENAIFIEILNERAYYLNKELRVKGEDYNKAIIPFSEASVTGGLADITRAVCLIANQPQGCE